MLLTPSSPPGLGGASVVPQSDTEAESDESCRVPHDGLDRVASHGAFSLEDARLPQGLRQLVEVILAQDGGSQFVGARELAAGILTGNQIARLGADRAR